MTTDKPESRVGLLISPDLFFTSKVTGTAQALGLRVDSVDDIATAKSRLEAGDIGCVLLDLAAPRVSVADLLAAMPESARVPIIAFGSHVSVELLESARAAGAEVMPRSQFSATLPDILRRFLLAT